MMKIKQQGLALDMAPNIQIMKYVGHFLFAYYKDPSSKFLMKVYATFNLVFILAMYAMMGMNLVYEHHDTEDLTANTITMLFFAHSIIKLTYFGSRTKKMYKAFGVWNNPNSHPIFAESNARFYAIAVAKMRRMLVIILCISIATIVGWSGITFFEEPYRKRFDRVTNETWYEEVPLIPIRSWFPMDVKHGMFHYIAFGLQVYFLIITILDANMYDLLFCNFMVMACEQICHLKQIMRPLMELSATLDTIVPNSGDLFKAGNSDHLKDQNGLNGMNGAKDDIIVPPPPNESMLDMDLRGIYSNREDFTATFRGNPMNGGVGPNGLTKKQELLVRSAIKYWVERHKHIVRLVSTVGDAWGLGLLIHMLVTTITLTLLAYQATKIDGINVYAFSTIGYIVYTLGQVFAFCITGNRLIDESSSVMEAAYSCHWYDGSEEAKTFVQIVCQQCQKAMSVSGAKFFTVSLDLFASVLGAVVTYFMVLVQLK